METSAVPAEDDPTRDAAPDAEHDDEAARAPASGTDEGAGSDRAGRLAPLVAGILVALPSLLAHYLPMTDLPMHESAVGILRHLGDAAYFPPELYQLNLGWPNQLFYFAAWPLSYVVGTTWAAKIVIAATQVLLFTGGAHFADYVGRSRWSVLLFAPLALGFTYYWGLITNLIGLVAFFYALPSFDRFADRPSARGAGAVSALFVLLYFAHGSVFVISVAVMLGLVLLRPLGRGTLLGVVPPALAAAGWVLSQRASSKLFMPGTVRAPTGYLTFKVKVEMLSNVLFGSHDFVIRWTMFAVATLTVGLLASGRWQERAGRGPPPPGGGALRAVRDLLHRYRFELLGVAFLVGYFVLPFNWNGATLVHERSFAPAWGILVVCAAPRRGVARVAKLTAGVVAASVLLTGWPQFVDASRTNRDLETLLAEVPTGKAVTLCSIDRRHPGLRVYSAPIAAVRSLALRGGRGGVSLLISPIAPVQVRPDLRWNDYEARELLYTTRAFKPAHDFRMFEYVIGHSREEEVQDLITEAFAPEADLVGTRGEWTLYRSRLPVVPLTSPDRPAPPDLDTVYDRLNYLLARRAGTPLPMPPSMEHAPLR